MTRPRLRECVEAWPDAVEGEHDPRCCRWPKSCSADIYRDDIDPALLEPEPTAPAACNDEWQPPHTAGSHPEDCRTCSEGSRGTAPNPAVDHAG